MFVGARIRRNMVCARSRGPCSVSERTERSNVGPGNLHGTVTNVTILMEIRAGSQVVPRGFAGWFRFWCWGHPGWCRVGHGKGPGDPN